MVNKNEDGGSRAAKKRARAKAKKQQQTLKQQAQQVSKIDENTIIPSSKKAKKEHAKEISDSNLTKKKLSLFDDDDDDGDDDNDGTNRNITPGATDPIPERTEHGTKKNAMKKKVGFARETNFDAKESEESSAIHDILKNGGGIPLTPLHILFPAPQEDSAKAVEDDSNEDKNEESTGISSLTTEERAKLVFASLLHPAVSLEKFYSEYWEKKPLVVSIDSSSEKNNKDGKKSEHHSKRLDGFLTKVSIEQLLSAQSLRYGKDINVTNYTKVNNASTGEVEKRRITLDLLPDTNTLHNSTKEEDHFLVADAKDVWSNFDSSNCTIRLLCPHKYVDPVNSLLSLLEHEFGCMVGANAYLTPCSSTSGVNCQGFAPHYDDIDAFILQLEGCKHWKVYAPFSRAEVLPRSSSRDYTVSDMKNKVPVLDVLLKPGDVLYMPRGWIHQASTPPSTCSTKNKQKQHQHSLHLTMSTMQNWSWADLLEDIMPQALETSAVESLSLREGLPRNFVGYMGLMHQDNINGSSSSNDEDRPLSKEEEFYEEEDVKMKRLRRQDFKEEAKKRIMRVCKEAISMIDDGCDQIAQRFLSDRLPPALTETELSFTSEAGIVAADGLSRHILPSTFCRLARPNIARLVIESSPSTGDHDGDDDRSNKDTDEPQQKAVLYHCNENTREYHGNPLSPMEFEIDDAPALELLLTTAEPQWICVNDLTHKNGDIEDKIGIVQALYDEGILAIWNPSVT